MDPVKVVQTALKYWDIVLLGEHARAPWILTQALGGKAKLSLNSR